MGATKKCNKCKEQKELKEFPILHSAKDGRNSYCKICSALVAKPRHDRIKKDRDDFRNNFF